MGGGGREGEKTDLFLVSFSSEYPSLLAAAQAAVPCNNVLRPVAPFQ